MEDLDIEILLNRVSGNDADARAELKRMLKGMQKKGGLSATVSTGQGVRTTGHQYPPVSDETVSAGVIRPEPYRGGTGNVHQLADNVESCVGTMNDFLTTTRKIREPMNQLNSAWERLAHVSAVQSEAWVMLAEKLQKRSNAVRHKNAEYGKSGKLTRNPEDEVTEAVQVHRSSLLPKDGMVPEYAGTGNLR